MDEILRLDDHCFFVGPRPFLEQSDLPTSLPFSLGIHADFAIPMLRVTAEINVALDRAYARGSMASTPLGESDLSTGRMNEAIDGLVSVLHKDIKECSLLEIGSGAGGLMNALHQRGAKVTGLEIGPQGKMTAEKYGFRIVSKFFVPGVFDEKFDVVYSYGCVEHLPGLEAFFSASRSCLTEGGLMFHVVPNSEIFFEAGSLGHLVHEHINYLSPENGIRLFEAQGFKNVGAKLNRAGNELMLWGYFDSNAKPRSLADAVAPEAKKLATYAERLAKNDDAVMRGLQALIATGKSIGFYAGGFDYAWRLNDQAIRYFDGDSSKHGKCWLKGLGPIESPDALATKPVDHLVIFKPYLFNEITRGLSRLNLSSTKILSVSELGA